MDNIVMIDVSKIKPSTDNRQTEDDIGYLPSVGQVGIINPIQVTKTNKTGYRVVAGNRRLASAVHFGLAEVPCIIMGAKDSLSIQAAENFDRKPLNPLDEADMIIRLRNDGVADTVIQDWLHINQRDFNRRLLLLDLCEEAKEDLRSGTLCLASALELATLKSKADQSRAYKNFGTSDKQSVHEAKQMVECIAQGLGSLPPAFLEYQDSNNRVCKRCQYASGCSDDYSLFPEEDNRYCHDLQCFRDRLEEYKKAKNLPKSPPNNCERVWCCEKGHEEEYIQYITDEGYTQYYKETPTADTSKRTSSIDKTLPSRKAHNKALKVLNPILTEIAQLVITKLEVRYVSLYRDELSDMRFEQDLIDRMAAYVCSELSHDSAVMIGKLLGYDGDMQHRLWHVWTDMYGQNPYRSTREEVTPEDIANSFAWAAMAVRIGKYNFDEVFLSKALSGSGEPKIIRKDNPLISLARDVVPEWDSSDVYSRWCKAWEDYVSEQQALKNSNIKDIAE